MTELNKTTGLDDCFKLIYEKRACDFSAAEYRMALACLFRADKNGLIDCKKISFAPREMRRGIMQLIEHGFIKEVWRETENGRVKDYYINIDDFNYGNELNQLVDEFVNKVNALTAKSDMPEPPKFGMSCSQIVGAAELSARLLKKFVEFI